MKILFLARSLDIGGAEKQLILLADGLARKGHSVTILTFYSGKLDSTLNPQIQFINLQKTSRWDNLFFLIRLLGKIKELDPHIIHSYLLIPNLFSALLKIFFPKSKVVWGLRSANILEGHYTRLDRVIFYLTAGLSWLPDLIISNSQTSKKYHSQYYPNSKIAVIPNGIDSSRFYRQSDRALELRKTWNIEERELLIGIVGRLNPIKDHPLFLKALSELKAKGLSFKALCLGSGDQKYKQTLLKLAQELGIAEQVRWIDHLEDTAAAYSAFDLSVLCSKSESFPNVVLESLGCGTPCVVTESAGDAPFIVAQYGLVTDSTPAQLAEGILELLKRKSSWAPSEISRSIYERFGQEILIQKTEELLLQ